MSKKMKRVAMDLSSVNAKARFKHQTLIQDYHELIKETEDTRHKLENTKQRKLTLLAEVRFLRRRYKYLVQNKFSNLTIERELVQPQKLETKKKTYMKGRIYNQKEAIQRNVPPVFNHKGRVYKGKEAAIQNTTPLPIFNQKETLHGIKESALYRGKEAATIRNPTRFAIENTNGSGFVVRNPAPVFDLNLRGNHFSGKEHFPQSRAPVFDLNQISREEEEVEDTRESLMFEDQNIGLIPGGGDELTNDLKLSMCRNIVDGSNRAGKRKISWQDPVALRV